MSTSSVHVAPGYQFEAAPNLSRLDVRERLSHSAIEGFFSIADKWTVSIDQAGELLGEQAWQQSGLGAPPDISALQQQITGLEQHNTELRRVLSERGDELEAARAANRDLIAQMNRRR